MRSGQHEYGPPRHGRQGTRALGAATLMLHRGVHCKVVQERLGDANILMTPGTYSHFLLDIQEEAADKLDTLFSKVNQADPSEFVWDEEMLVSSPAKNRA